MPHSAAYQSSELTLIWLTTIPGIAGSAHLGVTIGPKGVSQSIWFLLFNISLIKPNTKTNIGMISNHSPFCNPRNSTRFSKISLVIGMTSSGSEELYEIIACQKNLGKDFFNFVVSIIPDCTITIYREPNWSSAHWIHKWDIGGVLCDYKRWLRTCLRRSCALWYIMACRTALNRHPID